MACGTYLTAFLKSRGISVDKVGMITSINSAIAILATPLWGSIGDRMRSPRKVLLICLFGYIITYPLIALTRNIYLGVIPVMLVFVLTHRFFSGPTGALIDNTALTGCVRTGNYFGLIRACGSLGWVLILVLLASFIGDDTYHLTFYLSGIFLIPCILFLLSLDKMPGEYVAKTKEKVKLKDMNMGRLFKDPYYISYIAFAILHNIPQMCVMSFTIYLIEAVGGNVAYIGFIQAYRAAFEIPALLVSKKLDKIMSYRNMVIAASLLYGVQALLSGYVTSFPMLIALTTLSGLASGFNQAGSVKYILSIAPKDLRTTAQTSIGAAQSAAGMLGNFIGGFMILHLGVRSFYRMIGFGIIISCALFVLSHVYIRKVLKKEFVPTPLD